MIEQAINLLSKKNTLKRHSITGSTVVNAPSTLAAWGNYVTTYSLSHSLGYIPKVRVYYEPFDDGKVYPATGDRLSASGGGLLYNDVVCLWELTEQMLTIYLESASSEVGTRTIYWVIYVDET